MVSFLDFPTSLSQLIGLTTIQIYQIFQPKSAKPHQTPPFLTVEAPFFPGPAQHAQRFRLEAALEVAGARCYVSEAWVKARMTYHISYNVT